MGACTLIGRLYLYISYFNRILFSFHLMMSYHVIQSEVNGRQYVQLSSHFTSSHSSPESCLKPKLDILLKKIL